MQGLQPLHCVLGKQPRAFCKVHALGHTGLQESFPGKAPQRSVAAELGFRDLQKLLDKSLLERASSNPLQGGESLSCQRPETSFYHVLPYSERHWFG